MRGPLSPTDEHGTTGPTKKQVLILLNFNKYLILIAEKVLAYLHENNIKT